MWEHPATRRNVEELARQGRVQVIGPVVGPVASGETGIGRMEEPAAIVAAIERALAGHGAVASDLRGRRIVVSAGPTYEALDPVRYLGNRSSGKMGFAIAARAAARGAEVTLVTGPVSLATPPGARRVDVESAMEMSRALDEAMGVDLAKADALVMAAAVADFRAATPSATKIKKGSDGDAPSLALARNPDLLAAIGERRRGARPVLVGFALETGDDAAVIAYAKAKLGAKKVDVIVANAAHESLGQGTNRVALVSAAGAEPFRAGTKESVADRILDDLARRLEG
jgi:phosphopantothenoylcysteine decarboxylase/phosphopantothenate--cysteine ligase